MYICTGAQYRMYCNTTAHTFNYQKSQYQDQYQCINNNCNCTGNKDTCTCSSNTLSSCFCETYGNSIALTTAVSPVYDCECYNDTYICTGDQYHMYCDTTVSNFDYWRDSYQNQYQYRCSQHQKNCSCIGNKDNCTCYGRTLSSCFCESYSNSITNTTAVSPHGVYECARYNDTYICTGAQYRMYCNTSLHDFYYSRYEHQCWNNNCDCRGNKNTCTCYYSTSSCFCQDSISTKSLSPTNTGLNIILLKDYMDDAMMKILNVVAVIVGLVFLSLALLTFAFYRWNPGVNNVARINICLSLLLAHLLFLLTQQSLNYIHPNQVLCAVISGIMHFFFLSSFVWMLIEAVLLFMS
ncbi:uncharacterized protein LOC127444239 [Myxocyprinus asiaticus]|uniref:uncharacterized protein LOC127444239 n=1 Tax=Myxocyprinus asiaticus TaxID=70543 RepID=UPI0022212FBB|nr:uncharacterized protein LOC127444239 [Myxocyprinus asiaticus]